MSTFKAYLITPEVGPREYETARDRAVARAREVGGSFELVDLPATKADLVPFLNDLERHFATPRPGECPNAPPAVEPAPIVRAAPAAPPPPRDLTVDAVEDAILEATGAPFGRYLLAAIGRLGELGRDGWTHVQAFRDFPGRDAERNEARRSRPYAAAFDERGLRYLALAQIANLDDGRN